MELPKTFPGSNLVFSRTVIRRYVKKFCEAKLVGMWLGSISKPGALKKFKSGLVLEDFIEVKKEIIRIMSEQQKRSGDKTVEFDFEDVAIKIDSFRKTGDSVLPQHMGESEIEFERVSQHVSFSKFVEITDNVCVEKDKDQFAQCIIFDFNGYARSLSDIIAGKYFKNILEIMSRESGPLLVMIKLRQRQLLFLGDGLIELKAKDLCWSTSLLTVAPTDENNLTGPSLILMLSKKSNRFPSRTPAEIGLCSVICSFPKMSITYGEDHELCRDVQDSAFDLVLKDASQKPINMRELPFPIWEVILNTFVPEDWKILDLFTMDGSVACACEELGREYYGLCLSSNFTSVKERIQND